MNKLSIIVICLLFLAVPLSAIDNVDVHINYPDDVAYIGTYNTFNIVIDNSEPLLGISLGFEISGYDGVVQWNLSYGSNPPVNIEDSDADSAFMSQIFSGYSNLYDDQLPDSVLIGGIAIPSAFNGLPPGGAREVYSMQFYIPSGEPTGQICIDNIVYDFEGEWFFAKEVNGPLVAPDFNGCSDQQVYRPQCSPICFPVDAAIVPVADFMFAPSTGEAPLEVTFTDLSSGNPDTWYWIFGDGQTSGDQNPTHEYQVAGTYYPTLIVANTAGEDTLVSPTPIVVDAPPPPDIVFTCPANQLVYVNTTDTVAYHLQYNSDTQQNFTFTASDFLGWFMSPTYLQITLTPGLDTTINVAVIVPDGLGDGTENDITATLTSQVDPMTSEQATCVLQISNYICGDVNLDGVVDISDAIYLINFAFGGGPAPCEPGI